MRRVAGRPLSTSDPRPSVVLLGTGTAARVKSLDDQPQLTQPQLSLFVVVIWHRQSAHHHKFRETL